MWVAPDTHLVRVAPANGLAAGLTNAAEEMVASVVVVSPPKCGSVGAGVHGVRLLCTAAQGDATQELHRRRAFFFSWVDENATPTMPH